MINARKTDGTSLRLILNSRGEGVKVPSFDYQSLSSTEV